MIVKFSLNSNNFNLFSADIADKEAKNTGNIPQTIHGGALGLGFDDFKKIKLI